MASKGDQTVIFNNRTDRTFNSIFAGTIGICVLATLPALRSDMSVWGQLVLVLINGGTIAFLGWAWRGTYYTLNEHELAMYSGPMRKKIEISRLKSAVAGTTMWVGTHRYGTAKNGLVIRFDSFDEVYITPESNEDFVAALRVYLPDFPVEYPEN